MPSDRKETASALTTVTIAKDGFETQSIPAKNGDQIQFNNATGASVNILDENGVFGSPKAVIPIPKEGWTLVVRAPNPNPGTETDYCVDDQSAAKNKGKGRDSMTLKIKMGGGGDK